jgi:uncharacterized protein (TIGR00645 family)
MALKPRLETAFERTLFRSRWLMAPIYLGLAVALALLVVVFVKELVYYTPKILFDPAMTANDGILAVLTLVDLSLAGNLLLIVLFSGYENFVSKLDLEGETDRPPWMGTVDFSGLKMKLIASIVAISGIQLLKTFMNIGRDGYELNPDEAFWGVIIHLTFVTSGVLLALMDWLSAKTDKH